MNRILLFLLFGFIVSCVDDPTLDDDTAMGGDIVEPDFTQVVLTDMTVAPDAPANVEQTYNFSYTGNLLTGISLNDSSGNATFVIGYSPNNQVNSIVETRGAIDRNYDFDYSDTDQVVVMITEQGQPDERVRIDINNTNRVGGIYFDEDNSSTGTPQFVQQSGISYSYDTRANPFQLITFTFSSSNGRLAYEYDLENNPFVNMNQILKFLLFTDFDSHGKNNPMQITRDSGATLSATFEHEYEDGFPLSRKRTTDPNNTAQETYYTFSYTTQQ